MSPNITKPIGLDCACLEIESVCSEAYIYKHSGLRPPNLIIPLDAGSGRTSFITYMAAMYKQAGLLDFMNDDYIEVTFDGSMVQLRQAFRTIQEAAVYTNSYENIVALDISAIPPEDLDDQYAASFIKEYKKVCHSAYMVIFTRSVTSQNAEALLSKICSCIDNFIYLPIENFTSRDYANLIIKVVTDHGLAIKHERAFRSALSDMVENFPISNMKEAISIANTLVQFADFTDLVPSISDDSLRLWESMNRR